MLDIRATAGLLNSYTHICHTGWANFGYANAECVWCIFIQMDWQRRHTENANYRWFG